MRQNCKFKGKFLQELFNVVLMKVTAQQDSRHAKMCNVFADKDPAQHIQWGPKVWESANTFYGNM